jgi:hypothetical protein
MNKQKRPWALGKIFIGISVLPSLLPLIVHHLFFLSEIRLNPTEAKLIVFQVIFLMDVN